MVPARGGSEDSRRAGGVSFALRLFDVDVKLLDHTLFVGQLNGGLAGRQWLDDDSHVVEGVEIDLDDLRVLDADLLNRRTHPPPDGFAQRQLDVASLWARPASCSRTGRPAKTW